MGQTQCSVIRPPLFLRVEDRAVALLRVTADIALPPARRAQYRKWRSRGTSASPVERTMALMVELHGAGVRAETLRQWPQALSDLLDDLTCGVAFPTLTADALEREAVLQGEEDVATMRAMLHDTPDAHAEAARALRAEALCQLELARAHDHRALALRRTTHV